jgi:ABC-type transport system involved in multi-copper enzyme maturation permease subunit
MLLATVLVVPILASFAGMPNAARAEEFYRWVLVFYLQVALPLFCLAVLGDLIRSELQTNTLVFLTTRPLTRARLFLAKFVCELLWVELLAIVSTVLLLAVGLGLGIRDAASVAALFLLIQVLAVLAYGALSALFGMVHRRFLVLGAIYGLVVEVGIGQIPTNINNLSINRHLRTLLAHIPSFKESYDWLPEGTWKSVAILLLAPVALIGIAALLFTWREYHYNEEMNK